MTVLLDFDLSKPKCDPKILLDSGPPRALYKVNPRLIFGTAWWDEVRSWAYKKYNNACAACGKRNVRLEAHELYKVDKKKGRVALKDIVPVCCDCHSFIHQDLHRGLIKQGKLKSSDVTRILAHGRTILKKYKVRCVRTDPNDCNIKFNDWRLELNGVLYGPVTEEK